MADEHGRGPTDGHGSADGHGRADPHGRVDEGQHVWDNPRNVKLLFSVFYALCAVVLVLELVIERHEVHSLVRFFAFYPFYGFVRIVVLVLIAKLMRRALMRPEDYYDAGGRDASSRDASSRDG